MSHNITERDGIFTVREPAWHGLGVTLSDYPTRAEAQKLAHPWEPVTEPLYRKEPVIQPHVHTPECGGEDQVCDLRDDVFTEFVQVPDFVGVARSDDGAPLGVVGDGYEPVKNHTMYDIAEDIEGESRGDVQFETGGSLKGGRKVWLLIRLKEPLVVPGDRHGETIPYLALQNAHDGSGSFRGQATLTRIVCDNTAQMADLDATARGTQFTFRHTRSVHDRIEEARQALAGWRHSISEYQRLSEHLVATKVTQQEREEFLHRFIPDPPPHMASERVRVNVTQARDQWTAALCSVTCEGIENTAQGLLSASIEYAQHYRKALSRESRFKRAYLDDAQITRDAMTLLDEVCGIHA